MNHAVLQQRAQEESHTIMSRGTVSSNVVKPAQLASSILRINRWMKNQEINYKCIMVTVKSKPAYVILQGQKYQQRNEITKLKYYNAVIAKSKQIDTNHQGWRYTAEYYVCTRFFSLKPTSYFYLFSLATRLKRKTYLV